MSAWRLPSRAPSERLDTHLKVRYESFPGVTVLLTSRVGVDPLVSPILHLGAIDFEPRTIFLVH